MTLDCSYYLIKLIKISRHSFNMINKMELPEQLTQFIKKNWKW